MKSLIPAFFTVGAVMALTGAAVYITGWVLSPYIYTVGAVLVAIAQIFSPIHSENVLIRRLRRQQLLGAMLLIMTGVMMLLWHHNEWIICLTIAALLELYTAFRIPHEEAKEKGGK